MKANKSNPFESLFHCFVEDFGGEVLEVATTGATADYYFREYNIVAELKTLVEDSTVKMNARITAIVEDWIAANGAGIVRIIRRIGGYLWNAWGWTRQFLSVRSILQWTKKWDAVTAFPGPLCLLRGRG